MLKYKKNELYLIKGTFIGSELAEYIGYIYVNSQFICLFRLLEDEEQLTPGYGIKVATDQEIEDFLSESLRSELIDQI